MFNFTPTDKLKQALPVIAYKLYDFNAPALAEGAFSFTLVVCTSQNWFPFSNLSLPQPNDMKLIDNAYNKKKTDQVEFWWCHFN